MNARSILTSVQLAGISASLTACGSGSKVTNTKETSVGQQLMDLQNARE